jgi:hypothetical protein
MLKMPIFREFFGGWLVETITADAARRYQMHRREQGGEAATIKPRTVLDA